MVWIFSAFHGTTLMFLGHHQQEVDYCSLINHHNWSMCCFYYQLMKIKCKLYYLWIWKGEAHMLKLDVIVVVTSGLQWNCWSWSYVGVVFITCDLIVNILVKMKVTSYFANLWLDSQSSCQDSHNSQLRNRSMGGLFAMVS
jgi:hypothetical protein